jgi:MFS family permease
MMGSVSSAAVRQEPESPAKASLTIRDRVAMGVMVSGGWWMALIFTAIAPILSSMSADLGDPAKGFWAGKGYWIGQLTMTIPDIGIIIGGPIAGFLVERYGGRMLLFLSLLLYVVSGSTGLFIDDGTTMLGTRLLLGFSGAGIATATTALIGNRFEGETRVRALAYWSGVGAAGGVVSVFLAGQITHMTGGWHSPFILYAMALIILAVGIFALPARPNTVAVIQAIKAKAPSIRPLIPLYLGMVPLYVATFMTGVQISFLLSADSITDPVTQSWVIGAASAGSVLGAFGFSWLRPRFGARITLLTIIGVLAAGNIVMPLSWDPVIIAIGAAMNGMGGGMANPHFAAVLIERAPLAARGRAIGLLFTTMFFGEFMNPFIVTPLANLAGIHGAFYAVAAMLTAGWIGVALYSGRRAVET